MKTHIRAACIAATLSLLTACAGAQPALPTTTTDQQPPATASQALSPMHSGEHGAMMMDAPFDAMFIDGMIAHHAGAIAMAKQALDEAQRPEIKKLAQAIIAAQEAEIAQMKRWRAAWYPNLSDTGGMHDVDMGPMSVAAGDAPFDIRFIEAMIPHHEGAIAMARMALQKSARPEIRQLAEAIIAAQQAEIEQMKQWRAAWTK